jgi:CRP-like cAMP-binding protein
MDESRLKCAPLFAGLRKKERRFVAQRADEVEVPEGKQLAHEGDFAHEFFIIEQGTARVEHEGQLLAELGPGDFFGEIAIHATARRIASVVATSAMELIVLTSESLRAVERQHPRVADQIREAIAERLEGDGARA